MKIMLMVLATALTLTCFGCSSQTVSDSTITTKVKSKLAADTRTSALKIEVETVNGVVTLTGAVPNDTEKSAAEQIAKATEDVKNVNNRLTVQPGYSNADKAADSTGHAGDKVAGAAGTVADKTGEAAHTAGDKAAGAAHATGAAAGDALILTKIKAQFVTAGIIGTNVDVTNGAVVLKGEVDNAQEKTQAESIAKKTDGVKSVSNQLTIKKK